MCTQYYTARTIYILYVYMLCVLHCIVLHVHTVHIAQLSLYTVTVCMHMCVYQSSVCAVFPECVIGGTLGKEGVEVAGGQHHLGQINFRL
jgi:hypothetical protein